MEWFNKYKKWIALAAFAIIALVLAYTGVSLPKELGHTTPVGIGQEESTKELADKTDQESSDESTESIEATTTGTSTGQKPGAGTTEQPQLPAGSSSTEKPGTTGQATTSSTTEAPGTTETPGTAGTTEAPATEAPTTEDTRICCTISISCATVLSHMEDLDPAKKGLIPANGVMMSTRTVYVEPGQSVYDALRQACQSAGIPVDASFTPMYNSVYVMGINNLYEFDCGSLSGWKYCVNGVYPNYGCSAYILKDGDVIQWNYTCTMNDL